MIPLFTPEMAYYYARAISHTSKAVDSIRESFTAFASEFHWPNDYRVHMYKPVRTVAKWWEVQKLWPSAATNVVWILSKSELFCMTSRAKKAQIIRGT